MKTGIITSMMLLFAVGMAQAQDNEAKIEGNPNVNTIVVNTTGDVTIYQGDKFAVKWDDEMVRYNMNFEMKDSVVYLSGVDNFEVTLPSLKYLKVNSCGDVIAREALAGENLSICNCGAGDIDLNLSYSNIYLKNEGVGDVTLRGDATALMVESSGTGDFNAVKLNHSLSFVNVTGIGEGDLGKVRKMVFVHNSNRDAGQISDNCRIATSLGSPIVFEQVGSSWRIKGYDHLDITKVANELCAAAPFFDNEQHRNWNTFEIEGMEKTAGNDGAKTTREQLDEDLGDLGKDITVGIAKGKRENWSEDQWNTWGDSLDLRFKEYEMEAKKFEMEAKKFEKEAKNFEKDMQNNVQNTKGGSHFLEPNWASFGFGLNTLLTPSLNQDFGEGYEFLEQRPMRSLYFELNCFGAGVAFDRNRKSGIFTGFGFSLNRYFFKNPIILINDPNQLSASWVDEEHYKMRKSRLLTMYFNVPLMFEFNPTRDFCIEAGVTGGIRLFAVNKVFYEYKNVEQLIPDASQRNRGFREVDFGRYSTSLFSLEGSLRVTYDDFGIFINYDILPTFDTNKAPDLHTLSFGFTILF